MEPIKNNQEIYKPAEYIAEEPTNETINQTVGFWIFLGLTVLFALPVVGLIACIIFMFAPKNQSVKNFARAMMVWITIRITAVIIAGSLLFTVIGNFILPTLNNEFGTNFNSIQDIFSIASDMRNGNYSNIIQRFRPQLIEMVGDEYAPLMDELTSGDYDKLINQIINREYAELLKDLQNNEYPALKKVLNEEDFNAFTDELEAAAGGKTSEFFDAIQNYIPSFLR